jgi:hypothetical protein
LAFKCLIFSINKDMNMKANVGGVDRVIRIVAGLSLIAWALVGGGPIWAWIGVVPLVTGLINFCPAWSLLGINTCKIKQQ